MKAEEGERLLQARQLDLAYACFMDAERAGEDANRCAAGRWMIDMLRGQFDRAWKESDSIRQRTATDPDALWKGEPIDGKRVMLRCLHGFGDSVQFLRYLPALRARAAQVTIQVAPRFVDLARCFAGVEEIITWGEDEPVSEPRWDVQVEVMQLPYLFRTTLEDLPLATNYLSVAAGNPATHISKMRVGLAWSAGEWNPSRSIPASGFSRLLETEHCEFWNLEGEAEGAEKTVSPALREDLCCRTTLIGLAKRIAALDVVITVDSLAAHVAGSIGVPVWVLLQHAADWRWMVERDDSPWYPTMRLFRQKQTGAWSEVVSEVAKELQQLAATHAETRVGA